MSIETTGFDCKVCEEKVIEGERFVCLVCENYELCESCHTAKRCNAQHRPNHPMQLVLPMKQLLGMGQILPYIKQLCCPGCGDKEFNESELLEHCRQFHDVGKDQVRCPNCVVHNMNHIVELDGLFAHLRSTHTFTRGINCSTCKIASPRIWYACLECINFYLCHDCCVRKRIEDNHKSYHCIQLVPNKYKFAELLQEYAGDFDALEIFQCPYCDECKFNVLQLLEHSQKYHRDHGSISVQCPICTVLRFPSRQLQGTLLDHLEKCHVISGSLSGSSSGSATSTTTATRECTICMEEITINARFLQCGHGFHRTCIVPWLMNQSTCPVCRTETLFL